MAERSQTNWVNLALLLGGAYVVIRYLLPVFQTAAQGVSAAGSAVTGGIANAYLALTAPPGITVTGNVLLPSGVAVPLNSLPGLVPDSNGNVFFTYGGSTYQIQPGVDANGNRGAVYVSTP